MQQIYRQRFDSEDRRAKDKVWAVIVADYLQRWVEADDTVLDVGSGFGEFLNHVKCRRRIGIDLNPDSESCLDPSIEFYQGDVCDLSFIEDDSVDVVFTSNLLEHLPSKEKVEELLGEVRRVLADGGHFIALGPNLRYLPGEYWDFWDHYTPITDRSLVEVLTNLGFRAVDCIPRFLPYTTQSAIPKAPWLVRLYLKAPIVWPILGRQFLIRVRKGGSQRRISVVVPVHNEHENIQQCLRGLDEALESHEHEILVCYDFDEDTTLAAIEAMPDRSSSIRLVKNTLGPGAANAIRAGFEESLGDVVVTSMADLSDPPEVILHMADRIRSDGSAVVSGSRYMRNGSQSGGPPLKVFLSRCAGMSLHWLSGMGTKDATSNFRAYRKSFLDRVAVESRAGFEIALELTVKAHLAGEPVSEVPSSWVDRQAGESRFQLFKWLPNYLNWYARAMAAPLAAVTSWVFFVWLAANNGWKEPVQSLFAWPLALPGAASVAALFIARRLRGRTALVDVLHPLLWLPPWPGWFTGLGPVPAFVISALLSSALIAFSTGGTRPTGADRS